MQFLASTWAEYGIDANGDGVTDRWDPADAIYGAANYHKASGAPGDTPDAVYAYNHSWAVRQRGHLLRQPVQPTSHHNQHARRRYRPDRRGDGDRRRRLRARASRHPLPVGRRNSGRRLRLLRAHPGRLPGRRNHPPTHRPRPRIRRPGPPIPAGQPLQPGDLVLLPAPAPHQHHPHVGLLVSPTEMVDAPHTGAVVRVEPYDWTDYLGATRPAI